MFFGLCNQSSYHTKTTQWLEKYLGKVAVAESLLLVTALASTIIGAIFISGHSYFGLANVELAIKAKVLFITAACCFLIMGIFETAVTGAHIYEVTKTHQ